MDIKQNSDSTLWNQFVTSHPNASVFHMSEWRSCFEKTYRLKTLYLEAEDSGRIVGLLPLALVGLKGIYRLAISLPFCSYSGPLAVSKDIENDLTNEARAIVRTQYPDVKGIELRTMRSDLDSRDGFVTMVRQLPSDLDILWNTLRDKERNQVRKAEKSGLKIYWGRAYLEDFYRIYAENMHGLGTPVHSKRWFSIILDTMQEKTDLVTAWLGKVPVGGMLIIRFKDVISILYASTLKEYSELCPNVMMYWEVLKFGCKYGFKYFDFGRSRFGSPTFNFKKHWRCRPVPLSYKLIAFDKKRNISSEEKYASNKALLVSRYWSKVPYWLSVWLGPRLRKYIP